MSPRPPLPRKVGGHTPSSYGSAAPALGVGTQAGCQRLRSRESHFRTQCILCRWALNARSLTHYVILYVIRPVLLIYGSVITTT